MLFAVTLTSIFDRRRHCGGRASGILSFGIEGCSQAGARFIDAQHSVSR